MKFRVIRAATLSCLVAYGCQGTRQSSIQQAPAAAVAPREPLTIPLAPYFRGLKTVRAMIGDASHTFLVDTAGGRTLIVPELAATMGCRPYGRDVGYRMNGEAVAFRNCDRLDVSLGAFALRLAPVAVFDVGALLPKELPRLDGVLALDAFRGQVLTIDWARNGLTIHGTADAEAAVRATGVPFRAATGENGASLTVLLPVRGAAGRTLWFLLDSGNVRGTLVARHVKEEKSLEFPMESAAMLGVGSGPAERHDVIVDDINYDGVLGAAFIETRVLTLDLRRVS